MFRTILLDIIKSECDNSQKILSQKTGIPTSTVNSWCKGKSEPNSGQLLILANYFGVTTDYLLGREEVTVDLAKDKSEVEKRKELRPSTLKLVQACEPLNDMGIAVVIGYIARLIEENPEFLQIRRSSN